MSNIKLTIFVMALFGIERKKEKKKKKKKRKEKTVVFRSNIE